MNQISKPHYREYSWHDMESLCKELSNKIILSNYKPDVIISIMRGGCFPGLLLSHILKIRELYTINIITTINDNIRAQQQEPKLVQFSNLPSLANKYVLLVDDVTNTGRTLFLAKNTINSMYPISLKTACPVWDTVDYNDNIAIHACHADYHVDKIHAWAKFPWEI